MRILLLAVMIVLCSSCEPDISTRIQDADSIEVIYFNKGDTLRFKTENPRLVPFFIRVLNGPAEKTGCEASGILKFIDDNLVKAEMEFSTTATGAKPGCEYLLFEKHGYVLRYNTGMYLDEIFAGLNKKQ